MGIFCYRIREKFSDLLEDRLSDTERERTLEHLSGCTECAGDYQLFRKSSALVAQLEPIPVPEDFTQRVLARVRQQGAASDVAWIPSTRRAAGQAARGWQWGAGLAAAAAVAALVVGLWMLMMLPRTDSASVPIAGKAAPPSAAVPSSNLAATPATGPAAGPREAVSPAQPAVRRGVRAGGPALARRGPVDSLYDQPLDEAFPLDRGGAQLVRDTRDTGFKIVPAKGRGGEPR
jgi:anti-sigma factor RsiW